MGKLRAHLLILWLSLKWVPRVNLGDLVLYKGERWIVANGVVSGRWDLWCDVKKERISVSRNDVVKIKTIKNYWGTFRSARRFYYTSWFSIWARDGVKDWMRGCRIWGRR